VPPRTRRARQIRRSACFATWKYSGELSVQADMTSQRMAFALAAALAPVACSAQPPGGPSSDDASAESDRPGPLTKPDASEISDDAAHMGADSPASIDSPASTEGGVDGSTGGGGLAGFCADYIACGGTQYASAQDCINAALAYWGACRKPELDTFSDCMMTLPCSEWVGGYIPGDTPCATQWAALENAPACQ
jgi:hypothetical protein